MLHNFSLSFDRLLSSILAPSFKWGSASFSFAEGLGALFGIFMIVCNLRVSILSWPFAILSSMLYFLIFFKAHLYANATLQLVFVFAGIWGLWQWLRSQRQGMTLHVRSLSHRHLFVILGLGCALWLAAGWILSQTTKTDVPYFDAFPAVFGLIGQGLLGRKYIENWLVWLFVNIVAMLLFAHRGLWLTVGLYGIYAVLAGLGFCVWYRLKNSTNQ